MISIKAIQRAIFSRRFGRTTIIIAPALIVTMICVSCVQIQMGYRLPDILTEAQDRLDRELAGFRNSLSDLSKSLEHPEISKGQIRFRLRQFAIRPYVIDCALVDKKGVLTYIEPPKYKEYEGESIANQGQYKNMIRTSRPSVGRSFLTQDDRNCIVIAYPILLKRNLVASLSVLFRPKTFLKPEIRKIHDEKNGELLVVQDNGIILYSRNSELIGTSIHNDKTRDPQFLKIANYFCAFREGTETYKMKDETGKIIETEICWTSVKFYDTSWRIVLVRSKEGDLNKKSPRSVSVY